MRESNSGANHRNRRRFNSKTLPKTTTTSKLKKGQYDGESLADDSSRTQAGLSRISRVSVPLLGTPCGILGSRNDEGASCGTRLWAHAIKNAAHYPPTCKDSTHSPIGVTTRLVVSTPAHAESMRCGGVMSIGIGAAAISSDKH